MDETYQVAEGFQGQAWNIVLEDKVVRRSSSAFDTTVRLQVEILVVRQSD
jgi:hypothetical protein